MFYAWSDFLFFFSFLFDFTFDFQANFLKIEMTARNDDHVAENPNNPNESF